MRNIVDGLGPANGISQIRIASSGPDAFATQADSWLQFSIPTGRGPGTIKAQWMAFLVAGSFRDESAQSTALPAVGGAILRGYGAQLIGGSDHPPITVTAPIDQIIASRLTAIGLTSTSITDAKPELGVAPIVITQTSDPASFVAAHPEPWGEVFGDLNTYEGTYLEVDDTTGSPVIVGAYASRAAHGVEWVRPGLRSFTMGGLHTTGPDSHRSNGATSSAKMRIGSFRTARPPGSTRPARPRARPGSAERPRAVGILGGRQLRAWFPVPWMPQGRWPATTLVPSCT